MQLCTPPVFLFACICYKSDMDVKSSQPVPWIFWILLVSVIFVVGQTLYIQTFSKDYLFFVEAPCDPAVNECYVRDCSILDECPPNDLATFRTFQLPASRFEYCSDNSCLNICPSETYFCEELPCSDQEDYSCEGPKETGTTTEDSEMPASEI